MPMHPSGKLAHWLPEVDGPLLYKAIGELLRKNAAERPDRPAIKWPDGNGGVGSLTYAELLARAEQGARWLLERVNTGDVIAIWSMNRLEYGVMFYAAALAGVIMTAFNQAWTDVEAKHAAELTTPSLFFVGKDAKGQDLRPRAEKIVDCPVLDLAEFFELSPANAGAALPDIAADHPYVIQFTSGTTGRAKGALLTQGAGVSSATLVYPVANLNERDVWLVYTPFYHIGGSCTIPLAALACGGSYVLLERFDVDLVVSLIEPAAATQMSGVPTMWFDLLRHPKLPHTPQIRVVTVGGAAVPAAIGRAIEERTGGRVAIAFAQSECPAITLSIDGDIAGRTETVGKPVPHTEVKIVDPQTGETLGINQVGEIRVRSPCQMKGYWRNPEATAATIDADGFLHTGDLGEMDADGTCRFRGRCRELIIRGGENIYPIEVEDVILRHPDVALVAVIGIPDDRMGQEVAAVVQPKAGRTLDANTLAAHVSQHLSHFKVPRQWRFVEALPMTASAKVRKVGLEALFENAATA